MGIFGDIGSAISSGVNFVGDVLTGGAAQNAQAVEDTNAQNIAAQQATNAQQVALSNTTYQRSVADLKAAGLNPMLAYSGNTDPMPSIQAPQAQASRPGDAAANLFNTASSIAGLGLQRESTNSQIDVNHTTAALNQAKAEQATANAGESKANMNLADERTYQEAHRTKGIIQDNRTKKASADQAEMDRDVQRSRFSVDKSMAKPDAYLERANQAAGVISKAMPAIKVGVGSSNDARSQRAYERGTRAGSVTRGY